MKHKKIGVTAVLFGILFVSITIFPIKSLANEKEESLADQTYFTKQTMVPEITKYILGDDTIMGRSEPSVEILLFTWDGIPVTRTVKSDRNGHFTTELIDSMFNGQALKVLDKTNSIYSGLFFPSKNTIAEL